MKSASTINKAATVVETLTDNVTSDKPYLMPGAAARREMGVSLAARATVSCLALLVFLCFNSFAQSPPTPAWYGADLAPMPPGPTFPFLDTSVTAQASGPCQAYVPAQWKYPHLLPQEQGCAATQSITLTNTQPRVPTAEMSIPVTCTFTWAPFSRNFGLFGYDLFGDTLHCVTRVQMQVNCLAAGLTPQDSSGNCWTDLPHPAFLDVTASCSELSGTRSSETGCPAYPNSGTVLHTGILHVHLSQPKTVIRISTHLELTTKAGWLAGSPPKPISASRDDVGPEIDSQPVTVEVEPSLLMTLDVLPFKIIYAPPGDQSQATFDETKILTDSVTFTLGSSNANAVSTDVADEASGGIKVGMENIFNISDTATTTTEHKVETTTTTNSQNVQAITFMEQFGKTFLTPVNNSLDKPGTPPWVNDLFEFVENPQIMLWDFGPDPTAYALVTAVDGQGTREVRAGLLLQCANSTGPNDLNNPLGWQPKECRSFLSLDPFAAAFSQNAGQIDTQSLPANPCEAAPGSPIGQLQSAGQLVCYSPYGPSGVTPYQASHTSGLTPGSAPYKLTWQSTTQAMNTAANGGASQSVVTDIRTNKNVAGFSLTLKDPFGAGTTLGLNGHWTHTVTDSQAITMQVNYQTSAQLGSSIQDTGTVQYQDQVNPILVQPWLDRRFGTILSAVPVAAVDSLSPISGAPAGGDVVTILGSGFMSGAIGVKFCYNLQYCLDGKNVEVLSDSALRVTTPPTPNPPWQLLPPFSVFRAAVYVINPGGFSVTRGSNEFDYGSGLTCSVCKTGLALAPGNP